MARWMMDIDTRLVDQIEKLVGQRRRRRKKEEEVDGEGSRRSSNMGCGREALERSGSWEERKANRVPMMRVSCSEVSFASFSRSRHADDDWAVVSDASE